MHGSHSHVRPLYIHWEIKLQKFSYAAIYVLVGANCVLYSSKYHSLQDLMNSWALIPRGNGVHRRLEMREAQPHVKMFEFLPPKPYTHLGNSCGRQAADDCRQLSIPLAEVACWRVPTENCAFGSYQRMDATGSRWFWMQRIILEQVSAQCQTSHWPFPNPWDSESLLPCIDTNALHKFHGGETWN